MTVTVNTDASYCPHQKVGGFACYIKCNSGLIRKSGKINCPEGPSDCELKAIANAFYILENSAFNDGSIDFIIINTDCKSIFRHVSEKSKYHAGKFIAKAIARIRENSTEGCNKNMYHIRHVKAHSGIKDARSWVNEWCDANAKIEMKKQRVAFVDPNSGNVTKVQKEVPQNI